MDRNIPNWITEFESLVKLIVELEPASWHDYKTESLWATSLGGGLYQVRNVPFYARELSNEDVIRASLVGGDLVFQNVERRGGHSSYRFFIMQGITDEEWIRFWQPLEKLGCSYERATTHLFAVDVPPKADIYRVYELLEAGEKAGVWGFEEGHCGHPLSR